MKLRVIIVISIFALLMPTKSFADADADRQTIFNDTTDFITTIGKTKSEKERIIRQRKTDRRQERLEKARIKRDRQSKRQMKRQQKIVMDKVNAINAAKQKK